MSDTSECFHDPVDVDSNDGDKYTQDESEVLTSAEDELLTAARNGQAEKVKLVLSQCDNQKLSFNINHKGRNKATLGWAAIHLAAYFGHTDVVSVLIKHGADINLQNDTGDTPLHKAAYTGREEVVILLLSEEADVTIKNAEGLLAKDLARTESIKQLIEAAENYDIKKVESEFLRAARDGDVEKLTCMLQQRKPANISCTDQYGNSALHNATYRGHKEVVVLLMQNGIDTTLRNARGQMAEDMASDVQMKMLVSLQPVKPQKREVQRMEGPLLKKTGVLGWRPVWTVLEKGVISLFRNRADASTGARRKSFRYLNDAKVKISSDQVHLLQLVFHDQSSWQLSVQLDTSAHIKRQVLRQKWVMALREHIAYSKQWSSEDARVSDDENDDDLLPLGSIQDTLQTAQAHQHLVEHQVAVALSSIDSYLSSNSDKDRCEILLAKVNTDLDQVVKSSQDMVKSLQHAFTILEQQDKVRQVQLEQEREKSRVLQDALHVLAEEHHSLEQSLKCQSPQNSSMVDSGDDEEFLDCIDSSLPGYDAGCDNLVNGTTVPELSCWGGRCQLPAPMFSRSDYSVWSILKQCIGRELSKITMPVIFNEPLSFLQRIVEYMEYSDILKKASDSSDPVKRLEYITAFAVSATASNWDRLGKPFNPLLGETYELCREDLGFKIVCEQVSHHPPISAFHGTSKDYTIHGAIHPKLKFWGKSIEVTPKGIVTLILHRHNEVYYWQNVNCCVHNIIVGKIWIEHYGTMEVNCLTTGLKSLLHFKPSGWFSKELHKIEGNITQNSKKIKIFYGKWIEALYSHDVEVWEKHGKGGTKEKDLVAPEHATPDDDEKSDNPPPTTVRSSSIDLQLPGQELLWQATPKPHNAATYYSFTLFAMMLNEMTEAQKTVLPPTDCRRRPDIRKMEEGDLDGASSEKNRLEEKQRAARRERKKSGDEWKPRWFKYAVNPHTKKEDWLFTDEYWNRDWSRCPDIF